MLYVYSGKQVRNATTIECVLVTAGTVILGKGFSVRLMLWQVPPWQFASADRKNNVGRHLSIGRGYLWNTFSYVE